MKPIPQEKRDAILRDYAAGEKRNSIAEKHGVCAWSVMKFARLAGIARRPGRPRKGAKVTALT